VGERVARTIAILTFISIDRFLFWHRFVLVSSRSGRAADIDRSRRPPAARSQIREPHPARLRSVTGEQKVTIFDRYVTGKTTAKPRRIDRLAIVKLRESPPTSGDIFL
jgi:hypothetical protein